MCVNVCAHTSITTHLWGSEDNYRSRFSPSTTWVMGLELEALARVEDTHGAVSSATLLNCTLPGYCTNLMPVIPIQHTTSINPHHPAHYYIVILLLNHLSWVLSLAVLQLLENSSLLCSGLQKDPRRTFRPVTSAWGWQIKSLV